MSYNFKESDGRQNMWLGSNKAKYYNTKYQNSCRSAGSSFSPPLYFKNQIGLRKARLAKKKIGKPPLLLGQKKYLSEQLKKCFTTQKINFLCSACDCTIKVKNTYKERGVVKNA